MGDAIALDACGWVTEQHVLRRQLAEEGTVPFAHNDRHQVDRNLVEQLLLETARRHTAPYIEDATKASRELRDDFTLPEQIDLGPSVYYRLTDNWLELTVRFVVPERGVRGIKDAMSRDILRGLDAANIGLASGTYEIVGLPPVRVVTADGEA